MNNNPNQPRNFDVVLGGQTPPPVDGVVLGGLEGVKHRLKSTAARERAAALIQALRYGEEGLDLLIQALKDPSEQVQLFAGRLLRQRGGEKGKQALLRHNPWLLFTMLEDWKAEDFEPAVGITYPVGTAYHVNLYFLQESSYGYYQSAKDFTLKQFQKLVKEPRAVAVEALVCWFSEEELTFEQCETFVTALCKASKQLTSLKALFIGDRREHEYHKSRLYLGEICKLLEAFPHLEVLKLHGQPDASFSIEPVRHDCLKTLILETTQNDSGAIVQIYRLDLPALEYFELWGGKHSNCAINNLKALLAEQSFPSLCYLGLLNFEDTDELVEALVQSPILARLAVLNLSFGTLTDKGAQILLNCPAINQLHTLNVANNRLSINMIQQLSQLNCRLIAQPQDDKYYRYFSVYE